MCFSKDLLASLDINWNTHIIVNKRAVLRDDLAPTRGTAPRNKYVKNWCGLHPTPGGCKWGAGCFDAHPAPGMTMAQVQANSPHVVYFTPEFKNRVRQLLIQEQQARDVIKQSCELQLQEYRRDFEQFFRNKRAARRRNIFCGEEDSCTKSNMKNVKMVNNNNTDENHQQQDVEEHVVVDLSDQVDAYDHEDHTVIPPRPEIPVNWADAEEDE